MFAVTGNGSFNMALHATKIIAQYEAITGESFQAALIRMAKENRTGTEAAEFIGFCSKQRLDIVIKRLGYIPVVFRGRKLPGTSKSALRARRARERNNNESN